MDWSKARRPNYEVGCANVDFTAKVVDGRNRQAHYLGVTQKSLIKMWVAERLG